MQIQAVIFDLDGTLVDTNPAHVAAWQAAFAAHGYDVPADRIAREIGKGGDQLVPAVIGREADERVGEAIRKAHGKEFLKISAEERFRVLPGAEDLIRGARERGLLTALATSSQPEYLQATVESCGVDFPAKVHVVVTAGEAAASKPAPDLVAAAVAKLGVPAGRCAMVGDTPYDAEAGGKAGVRCWGLLSGGFTAADLRAAGAAGPWRDAADLLAHLDELLG